VSEQFALFESPAPQPEGLRYAAHFVSLDTEPRLISGIRDLPLQPFQFEGKRRVASFGFRYDYALRQLQRSEPIPAWLDDIVAKVETFGGPATRIRQVLCTEYDVGVGIGWHRHKPPFRKDIRSFAGIRLQVPVPQIRWQVMGPFHARCRASLALPDVRRLPTDLGAQHSRRRVAAILDHVSNHEQYA
jgi:alkylated DNA repair dioxygenase AlkB